MRALFVTLTPALSQREREKSVLYSFS